SGGFGEDWPPPGKSEVATTTSSRMHDSTAIRDRAGAFTRERNFPLRRNRPSHNRIPTTTGKMNHGFSSRTWVAVAPPRYPVSRIAPRIEVRGITKRITQISSTIPRGTTNLAEYPTWVVPSTAGARFIAFTPPSKNRNNTINALMMRPLHRLVFETEVI